MVNIDKIRAWLEKVLGPTAHVERYSDEYCLLRFRNMLGFYGSSIVRNWGLSFPTFQEWSW